MKTDISHNKQKVHRKNNQKRNQYRTTAAVIIGTLLLISFFIIPTLPVFKYRINQVEIPAFSNRPYAQEDKMGAETALITIEEFSSYSCNHCQNFALNFEEYFIQNFVATGAVSWQYFPVTYDDPTLNLASKATYCAMEQNKFWEYRDVVFANQGATFFYPYTETSLTSFALALDLEQDTFGQCLTSSAYDDKISANTDLVQQAGITGTPTFRINGETLIVGADPNALLTAIETALQANSD